MVTINILDIISSAKKVDKTVSIIEEKLFPDTRTELEKRLQKFYNGVVDDFKKIYPDSEKDYKKFLGKTKEVKRDLVRKNRQQFAFYDAQNFINLFLSFHLFIAGKEPDINQKIIDEIKKNEKILYTKQAVDDFTGLFNAKLFNDAELRLFLLPYSFDRESRKLDDIIELLNKIARLPEEIRAVSTQLNEISEKLADNSATTHTSAEIKKQNTISDTSDNNVILQDVNADKINLYQNIHTGSPEITTFLLAQIKRRYKVKLYNVPAPNKLFTGRENKLKEIHKNLQQGNNILLFKGYGGIGKTTLAIEYCNRYKSDYDHIFWIVFDGNLKSSVEKLYSDLSIIPDENKSLADMVLAKINNLSGKKLLVIDNFFTEDNKIINELRNFLPNVKKLLTSRKAIEQGWLVKLEIEKMPKEDAKEMFLNYYGYGGTIDDDKLDTLMELVDYHTFTLELSAKLLKEAGKETDIDELIAAFKGVNNDIANYSVTTNYTYEELKINGYLNKLFDLSNLDEDKIKVLRYFAVLPVDFMPYDEIKQVLKPEETLNFKKQLNELDKLSWLQRQKIDDDEFYRCPPVIRQFILNKYPPEFGYYKNIVLHLIEKYAHLYRKNPVLAFKWLPYGSSLLYNLKEENEKTATLSNNISLIYKAKGDYDRALEYASKDLKITEQVLEENHPDLANSYNNISTIYHTKGDYDRALEFALKALNIFEQVLEENHPYLATLYSNISMIYRDKGDYDQALEFALKALNIFEQVLEENHPDLATSYNNISMIYQDKGNYDRSLEFALKALKIREQVLEENHPSLATSYNNISMIYQDKGNYDRSLEFALKALIIYEQVLEENHPHLATSYNNISMIYKDKGDYDSALEFALKAFKIREQVLEENHPDLATSYNNISVIYKAKGDYNRALEFALKALKIREQILDKNHPDLATSYNNISLIYHAKGDYFRALEYAFKASKIFEQVFDENHPSLATLYNNLAHLYYKIGEKQKAYGYICKAVAILQKKLAAGHPYLKSAEENKAYLERELGIN